MLKRWYNWLLKLFRKEKLYSYQIVDDVPDRLRPGTVYLVSNQGYVWQCVLLCPCGCGAVLYTNLMSDHHPHWRYHLHGRTISLRPSIDRLVGCRSHFFLTEGKIIWCWPISHLLQSS